MKDAGYRSASPLAILFGIAAFLALLYFIFSLGDVTKSIGRALLFIPENIGLVQVAAREEVQSFELISMPPNVNLPAAGRYAIYTDDYDLLVISDEIARTSAEPWIKVVSAGGQPVEVEAVGRGLAAYDSPYASGRPVYIFSISAAGDYQISGMRRPAEISVLPDRVTGREGQITLYMLVQLGLLAILPIYWFNRRRVAQQNRVREVQRLKHIHGDVISQLHKPKDRAGWK